MAVFDKGGKMPRLELTNDQIVNLVRQLPKKEKGRIIRDMILTEDELFLKIMGTGKQRFNNFCRKRNINANGLNAEEKEKLIDDVLHEAD